MARFDVYANPDAAEKKRIPYFLDIQSDHIQGLQTRVVVPLWKVEFMNLQAQNLHPSFIVNGQQVVMDTPALGATPTQFFSRAVANLGAQQLIIQDAVDALFGGY